MTMVDRCFRGKGSAAAASAAAGGCAAGESRPLLASPKNCPRRPPPPARDEGDSSASTFAPEEKRSDGRHRDGDDAEEPPSGPRGRGCRRNRSRFSSAVAAAAATAIVSAALALMFVHYSSAAIGRERGVEGTERASSSSSSSAAAAAVVAVDRPRLSREASEESSSSPISSSTSSSFRTCPPGVPTVSADVSSFPSYLQFSDLDEDEDEDEDGGRTSQTTLTKQPKRKTIDVSYDSRSVRLNGSPALFLGGSVHPVRSTESSWSDAMDEMVRNGLNLVTVYVFWSYHRPSREGGYDWTLPSLGTTGEVESEDGWELSDALWSAACRGLFVHVRVGPYQCAEYNYGGIPEWVPLMKNRDGSPMEMRRWDGAWMDAMEGWVSDLTRYLADAELFADQGGPIVMGQIENELGGEGGAFMVEEANKDDASSGSGGGGEGGHTVQDYADWCGSLARKLRPSTLWTMCNGLTAPDAVNTCNGNYCDDWLGRRGNTGRVQSDQPALWTEDEGGYQVWAESPSRPRDYFWGRTASDDARAGMRWFARGGSHLNHYMWRGGYNRGRTASANVMNAYATDAPVCPTGERRHPKFDHLGALHKAIGNVSDVLLGSPTALGREVKVEYRDPRDGRWKVGDDQRMFAYGERRGGGRRAVFVENDADASLDVRLPADTDDGTVLSMNPRSSALVVDGTVTFDSSLIDPEFKSYKRKTVPSSQPLGEWHYGQEEIGASEADPLTVSSNRTIEHASLMNLTGVYSSDYVWYETIFLNAMMLPQASLHIEAQGAMALSVFLDGTYQGEALDFVHMEGPVNFTVDLRTLPLHAKEHRLAILSESLGYHKLVGRWGSGTEAKTKGPGKIVLTGGGGAYSYTQELDVNHKWRSRIGLHGETGTGSASGGGAGKGLDGGTERGGGAAVATPSAASVERRRLLGVTKATAGGDGDGDDPVVVPPCSWAAAQFYTPGEVVGPSNTHKSLMLDVTSGRGHVWLNGIDLGRYWNVTRGGEYASSSSSSPPPRSSSVEPEEEDEEADHSQRYYHLPRDYLRRDGAPNDLILFDMQGGLDLSEVQLVVTWLEKADAPAMEDEVDFPSACLV